MLCPWLKDGEELLLSLATKKRAKRMEAGRAEGVERGAETGRERTARAKLGRDSEPRLAEAGPKRAETVAAAGDGQSTV